MRQLLGRCRLGVLSVAIQGIIVSDGTGAFTVAIGALSGAVAFLFRIVLSQNKEHTATIKKQGDKNENVAERLGRLEGEREGIERLSQQTLEVVHKAIQGSNNNSEQDQ